MLSFWTISKIQKNKTIYVTSRIHWWPWIWPWPSNDLEIRKKCSFCGENAYISISARLNSFKICSPMRLYVYFRFSEKNFERNSYFRFMSNFSKNPNFGYTHFLLKIWIVLVSLDWQFWKEFLPISKFSKIFGRSEIRPNFEKFEYWLWHL